MKRKTTILMKENKHYKEGYEDLENLGLTRYKDTNFLIGEEYKIYQWVEPFHDTGLEFYIDLKPYLRRIREIGAMERALEQKKLKLDIHTDGTWRFITNPLEKKRENLKEKIK